MECPNYFNYNSKPLNIETENYLLRSGGVVNDDGSFSIAIVNRHPGKTEIQLSLENLKPGKKLRKYVYDSNNVPRSKFGDLQDYEELLDVKDDTVSLEMPGNAIVMLTTDYTEERPAAVTGVRAEAGTVSWDASADPSHVYYRVYKGETPDFAPSKENQIASTIAEKCVDPDGKPGYYKVCSVNRSGNCSL